MTQNYTILFDLDGTLVDTAPDLMNAHNHVMTKYGYQTKSTEEIRNLVGKGASALIGRSLWGNAKEEFGKIKDQKTKNEMVKEFINFYGKNNIEKEEAKELLKKCNSINMVGKKIISLSVNMGIGSEKGVKEIDGVPFLIVYKV